MEAHTFYSVATIIEKALQHRECIAVIDDISRFSRHARVFHMNGVGLTKSRTLQA